MALAGKALVGSFLLHGGAIAAVVLGCAPFEARPPFVPPKVTVELREHVAATAGPQPAPVPEVEVVAEPDPALPLPSDVCEPLPVEAPAPRDEPPPPLRPQPASPELLQQLRAEPPAHAPATVAAAPAARVLVPEPGSDPAPEYPPLARRRGWQGDVLLRVECGVDGTVLDVVVLASSGHAVLDEAAVAAVRSWRFVGGPGHCVQPITFRLGRTGRAQRPSTMRR